MQKNISKKKTWKTKTYEIKEIILENEIQNTFMGSGKISCE